MSRTMVRQITGITGLWRARCNGNDRSYARAFSVLALPLQNIQALQAKTSITDRLLARVGHAGVEERQRFARKTCAQGAPQEVYMFIPVIPVSAVTETATA